jgi:serine/threonine protein kinase
MVGLPTHVRLVEVVGTGGSGTVWRARDRRAGRDVAVKVIEPGSGSDPGLERFEREARALARLRGVPGVVAVHALGRDGDGRAWIVTDLWPGGTLADRSVPVPAEEVVAMGEVLAGALARAHELEVVHGDVTPANVLLDGRGGVGLADFGVAVLLGGRSPAPNTAPPFTPAYAAPEVRDGAGPSPASDVYGLGATLREAAGPVRGLDDVLARCCGADPARRPTAAEVRAMLATEDRRRARATRGRPGGG